uniref:Aminopeptidase n=1 Tax=Gadus morhua TaxID=8049 RepID=A0A8C5A4H5_GADMO
MGAKGFFISKAVGVVGIVLGAGAVATIIALSVVYSQEKAKTDAPVAPTDGTGTTLPTVPTPAPSNEPWDKYRLPESLVPETYTVTLHPRLIPDPITKLYIFTGTSHVVFKCVKETQLILIHSNKLNYTKALNGFLATLTTEGGGAPAPAIKSSGLVEKTQYLVLQLSDSLVKDQKYKLSTTFTGELADDLGGFYRSEYLENGVKKIVATTQMQPTDARKAFPCFDEPAMKAIFHITLVHAHGTRALSNGMETGELIRTTDQTIDGMSVQVTTFEPTKKMSTYLLAFIVSDFGFIQTTLEGVLIRIFARKAAIDANQGEYALSVTGPILKFFENYYNATYPLPKSDQIALPDFNAGAMENWGLITYRETALLYDAKYSSNSNKERIASIISHELAHMAFVKKSYHYMALCVGFASYVEYLGADHAEPSWGVKDLTVLSDIHRVFAVDALASSHPLSSKAEDIQRPEQISELFDAISYSKVQSTLTKINNKVSLCILQTYLNKFAYGNTVYTDLWDHLQMAVDESGKPLPGRVHDIMNTWVLQMGFPVITIDTATGLVTQKHFLLDPESNVEASPYNYEWIVPITWMKTNINQPSIWLTKKSDTRVEMKVISGQWVLANLDTVGYYRVNYDMANWESLLNALTSNHQDIPKINRAQLIDDAFNLARAKEISTILALRTTQYLTKETEYMPWESALDNLDFFYLMFDRSEVLGPMQAYLLKQVTPLFDHFRILTVDWTIIPPGHMDQYNQVNAIGKACSTGLPQCQTLVQGWFTSWMDNPAVNPIEPNLRSTVYCSAIAAGGAKEWDFAWDQFLKASIATEAEKLRAALACTKEPWLLNRYLEYTLNPSLIRKQDATSTIVYIASNVVGQPLAWDFIRDRWSYIFNQYGGGSFSFSNLINGVTERFSSKFELQQLEQFKKDNEAVGFGSGTLAVEQAIERTKANMMWISENKQQVLKWFVDNTLP